MYQDPKISRKIVEAAYHPTNVVEAAFREWNRYEKLAPVVTVLDKKVALQTEEEYAQGRKDAETILGYYDQHFDTKVTCNLSYSKLVYYILASELTARTFDLE